MKRYLIITLCLLGTHFLHAVEGWLESEYLLWKTKETPLPVPLLTSATLSDPVPGALGQPGTKILMGKNKIDLSWQHGFRISLGGCIEECRQIGIEGCFFMLPKKSYQQSIQTSGEPGSLNLAVPIYDITGLWGLRGIPGETVFILPGPLFGPGFQGRFTLKLSSRLLGSEFNVLANVLNRCRFKMDFISGFRWVQLKESLLFMGETAALPNADVSGFYNCRDSFNTNNDYYGSQVGLKGQYNVDRWLFMGFFKTALGCMHQKVRIDGKSQTSNGNLFYMTKNTSQEVLLGGIFSEPTNLGSHHHYKVAALVETGFKLSYQFVECCNIGLGYNFLWLNHLLRPGDQIDRNLNPTRTALAEASRDSLGVGPDKPVPFGSATAAPRPRGAERPDHKHHNGNYWAQGLSISLEFQF